MSTFQDVDFYSSVTLVDRLGLGGKDAEFLFDGIPFPFVDEDGKTVTEKVFPKFVAEWLFAKDKHRIWTKPERDAEGQVIPGTAQYLPRFGIKNCPQKILELWGEHVGDCSPIERDPDVIEGSEAPLYRTEPVRVQRLSIPPNEQPRDRQGRKANVTPVPAGRA
jgi:hypothetical protein